MSPWQVSTRIGNGTFKGYEKSEFKDAFNRYLSVPLPLHSKNERNNETPLVEPHKLLSLEDYEKEQNKTTEQACNDVTLKNASETNQAGVYAQIREHAEDTIDNFWNSDYPVFSNDAIERIRDMKQQLSVAKPGEVTEQEFKGLCDQYVFINTKVV